jgi:hypothetical protein
MSDVDSVCLQSIAQRARHHFRIAEIAHENSLFIGERKKSGPALPTRSPMARARKRLMRSHPHTAQAAGTLCRLRA